MPKFEWDDRKAAANWRDHGVTFEQGAKAYLDPFGVELLDDRKAYGEERFNVLGMCDGVILHVTYTERGDCIRIISARRAEKMRKTSIFARTRADRTLVEELPDGIERPFPVTPMRPMTDEEVHAAALADPDAKPLTSADLLRMKRTPRTKIIRRALGLTQEEFAARYQIPVGTLRDWEQGRVEPDQPARAYLRAIAGNPEGVLSGLQAASPTARPSLS